LQMRIIFFNIFLFLFLIVAVFFVIFWGKGQVTDLTRQIWPLGLVILVPLCVINVVFILNRKLLALLEEEDWPALTVYLEKKIYEEGRYKPRYVKLLVQSCLATGNFDGAVNLKNRLAAAKPALVEDNALILGTAYLLGGNTAAAVEFFRERLEKGEAKEMEWLRWFYGFSLVLTRAYEQAGTVMGELAANLPTADMPSAGARDALVTGLAAFVLTELMGKKPAAPVEWRIRAEEGKSRVRRTLKTAGRWSRKAEKLKTKMHGAVIRSYVDKTGAWIWGGQLL
jgi:hypothetical protein